VFSAADIGATFAVTEKEKEQYYKMYTHVKQLEGSTNKKIRPTAKNLDK